MSTIEKNQLWSDITDNTLDSKYEKCRNITEEIYKRINITFEIKKLEEPHSDISNDLSDQIDSNELSNETDLFAYDKSDSISSSVSDLENKSGQKYINLNNNEETSKFRRSVPVFRPTRPKKKFRKRIKKHQQRNAKSDTDGSSDEGLPLSRIVDINAIKSNENSCDAMKNFVAENTAASSDLKSSRISLKNSNKEQNSTTDAENPDATKNVSCNKEDLKEDTESIAQEKIEQSPKIIEDAKVLPGLKNVPEPLNLSVSKIEQKEKTPVNTDWKCCPICQMSFRGDRGLRRHMSMSHIVMNEDTSIQQAAPKDIPSKPVLEAPYVNVSHCDE